MCQHYLRIFTRDYPRGKWTRQPKLKSCIVLLAFLVYANDIGKDMHVSLLPQTIGKIVWQPFYEMEK